MTVTYSRLFSGQTKWLRKFHKASRVGVMLLRQLGWQQLSLRQNYSYSVYLWHYYLAEYEYTIQLTIWAK